MKTKEKTVKIEIEIPQWTHDRMMVYLSDELEISKPEKAMGVVIADQLLAFRGKDISVWFDKYFYPNRETAARVARRYFHDHPSALPIVLKYKTPQGVARVETFESKFREQILKDAAKAESPQLVDVPLKITSEQDSAFSAIGRHVDGEPASVDEVILALACSRIEMLNGGDRDDGLMELGSMLWTFAAKRSTPVDSYWETSPVEEKQLSQSH